MRKVTDLDRLVPAEIPDDDLVVTASAALEKTEETKSRTNEQKSTMKGS